MINLTREIKTSSSETTEYLLSREDVVLSIKVDLQSQSAECELMSIQSKERDSEVVLGVSDANSILTGAEAAQDGEVFSVIVSERLLNRIDAFARKAGNVCIRVFALLGQKDGYGGTLTADERNFWNDLKDAPDVLEKVEQDMRNGALENEFLFKTGVVVFDGVYMSDNNFVINNAIQHTLKKHDTSELRDRYSLPPKERNRVNYLKVL